MSTRLKNWFSDLTDKAKTSVKIEKEAPFYYLALLLLVILAILIRCSSVINGIILIKEFDPYYQFSSVQYIIKNGLFEWVRFHDYQFWYPEGVDRFVLRPGLLVTTVIIYFFLNFLGISVTAFQVAYYLPAFMGGVTVIAIFFLGKEILDKRMGLLSAFFLAFGPGYMQRTVTGFFDNETVGIFCIILLFLFFIRCVKNGKLTDGLLAGIFTGYLSLTWGGYTYPFLLLPVICFVMILIDRYSTNLLLAYVSTMGVGLLLFILYPGFKWTTMITDMDFMVPLLFLPILVVYDIIYKQKESGLFDKILTGIKWSLIPIGLTIAIIFWYKPEWLPFGLGGRLASIINPNIRETFHLVASVGEHAPSPWSVFYYNSLIPLLFVVPGVYFAIRRGNLEDVLLIIFTGSLFYFTGSMVRVILVFTPAMALLGSYGLSNLLKYFGGLMKKEQLITRRRRRQLNRTVAKSEGIAVYILIGILMFVQVNHAVTISAEQMGYPEIVSAGTFRDWEETLTYMKNNYPSTTVVVSWWDYGYWLSAVGNVTSVNDNGTWNQTRIGLTGMAFMQTNERYSAEVFRKLKADYVLVYFGHLANALGGDEGKWPWMLRICNDNTKAYESYSGFPKDNWYGEEGQVDTVFDEAEYMNETSGLYYEKWFQTTLTKLMFADEITTSAELPQNSPTTTQILVSYIEGNSAAGTKAKEDANGKLWSSYDTINGAYELQFFIPEYYSINHLVKVFRVDYSALDSSFEITDNYIDTDGLGYAKIKNTGLYDLNVANVSVIRGTTQKNYNFTVEKERSVIAPQETRYIMFDTNEYGTTNSWKTTDAYTLEISATMVKEDSSEYSFSNSSSSTLAVSPKSSSINIDRANSNFEIENNIRTNANIMVNNTGTIPVQIENIQLNTQNFTGLNLFNFDNPTTIIRPGESAYFNLKRTETPFNSVLNTDVNITAITTAGTQSKTSLAFNRQGFGMNIIPFKLDVLPEDTFLFDYSTYQSKPARIGQYYLNCNNDSYLLENGSLQLTLQNTGQYTFGLQGIYADGDYITNFTIGDGQSVFMAPGEIRRVFATLSDVPRNTPVKIFITGNNEGTCVSASAYIVPRNASQMIALVHGTDSLTAAFANETLRLVVKNVGYDSVTLDSVQINNTVTVKLNSSMVKKGNLTLNADEIALLQIAFSGLKVNLTNTLEIMINTTENAAVFSQLNLTARLPTVASVVKIVTTSPIYDTYADDSSHYIHIKLSVENTYTITLDSVYYKNDTTGVEYGLLSFTDIDITNELGNTITNFIFEGNDEDEEIALFYIDFNALDYGITLTQDEYIWLKIRTLEGYEESVRIKVKL